MTRTRSAPELYWRFVRLIARTLGRDLVSGLRVRRDVPVVVLGSGYGSWIVPERLIAGDATCYCAGVGEDITFDLGLIVRFGARVWAFDPTPRAAQHVAKLAPLDPRFTFVPVGMWNTDEVRRFYAPTNPAHVSHSIVNLQQSETYFEAPCKRVATLMRELGHMRLTLLKLDIEGAEYVVIDSLLADKPEIDILCIEYDEAHHPLDRGYRERIRSSLRRLDAAGYDIVAVDKRCDFTLVRRSLLS